MSNLEVGRTFVQQLIKHQCGVNALQLLGFIRQWKESQQPGRSPMADRRPWLTFQATATISEALKPGCSVFEFGGGGSTLYFLDRGAKVITVEHDSHWFDLLDKSVREGDQSANWTGLKQSSEVLGHGSNGDPADPDDYVSDDRAFAGHSFCGYASAIDTFPDGHFDVVVVDGRSRPSCIKHGAPKVKHGGLLVLDNTERAYYLTSKSRQHLDGFSVVLDKYGPTPGLAWFTKTTVWRRGSAR